MKKLIVSLFSLVLVFAFSVQPTFAAADKDCKDFKTWQEAQNYFVSHGGSKTNNFDNLDHNHNGLACESLPGFDAGQKNPNDSKGGSTAKPVHHSTPTVHHSAPTTNNTATPSKTTEKTTSSNNVTNTAKSTSGGKLPKTATNYPTFILMGALLLAAGLATRQLAKN